MSSTTALQNMFQPLLTRCFLLTMQDIFDIIIEAWITPKKSAIHRIEEGENAVIHFKQTYRDEALRQIEESRDLMDVANDIDKIQSMINEINNSDKSRFGTVGDKLFYRAKTLDSQMRQKYPMIDKMLNAADQRVSYRTITKPAPQMLICNQVVSELVQDYYGILCDTLIKKGIISKIDGFIERVD